MKLLAVELLDIFVEKGSIEFVYKCLYGFDAEAVCAIGANIPIQDLKAHQLQAKLKNYGKSNETKVAFWSHSEINRRFTSELGKGNFYLGAAEDMGECLFHTVAQLLSAQRGPEITAKKLRMKCEDLQSQGHSETDLHEMAVSSRDLVEQGLSDRKTVS